MDPILERIMGLSVDDIRECQRHLMLGGGTPGPTLVKARGVRIMDYDGRSYIDCTSQSWALYLSR